MGRRRLLAARSSPRPRFPTRGCRGRRRVRRPGRLSGRTPRAWPGTAWIGELTATGRASSGQAGQPPALPGRTAIFRVLERILAGSEGLRVAGTRSVPDRWPAGWSEAGDGAVLACIYICIGRGEGSRAMDRTHANETRGTRQKPLLAGRPCCRHSSPAELRRVAHMASQELPRGGRERVSRVSHLPCEQFGAHTETGTKRPCGAGFLPLVIQEGLPGEISRPCSWTPDRLTHTTARPLAFRQERTQKGEGEIRGDVRCSSVRRGCRGSSQSPSRGVSWD